MARARGPLPAIALPSLTLPRWRPQILLTLFPARHAPLYAVLAIVFAFHAPTLGYSFFGDDFVALGDIAHKGFWAYSRDVLLLRDMTPHWRPLTMMVYWTEYQLFGLNAEGFRAVSLALHMGAAVCLYAFVVTHTNRVLAASVAAGFFGLTASHVHTVTYVTALPHVLATFLMLASLLSLQRWLNSGETRWYVTSIVLYLAGIMANEASGVFGVILAIYLGLAAMKYKTPVVWFAISVAPFAAIAGSQALFLASCRCAGDSVSLSSPGAAIENMWIYLARLAYPVGRLPGDASWVEWTAGSLVAVVIIAALIRGPFTARLAATGVVLMLLPYAPVKPWTATRYTYAGAAFFGILLGLAIARLYDELAKRRLADLAHGLGGLATTLFVAGMGLQTFSQNDWFVKWSNSWRTLSTQLQANEERLPERSYVVVLDGEWSHSLWVPTWVPSVARTLYGDALARDLPSWLFEPGAGAMAVLPEFGWGGYVMQYDGAGHLKPYVEPGDQPATR